MSKEETGSVPVLVRLPKESHEYLVRKMEQCNKERRKELKRPINKQDLIRELVRQDAVKKSG